MFIALWQTEHLYVVVKDLTTVCAHENKSRGMFFVWGFTILVDPQIKLH